MPKRQVPPSADHPVEGQALRAADRHPVVAALKSRLRPIVRECMDAMFKGAGELLLEFAETTTDSNERHLYLDTIRALRTVRDQIVLVFLSEFVALFRPRSQPEPENGDALDVDPEDLALKPDEALDEMIAVSNMAAKVEAKCPALLWEFERRMASAQERGVPLTAAALMPISICQAFRKAAEFLQVGPEVKLGIYKLFEHFVVAELPQLYTAANQVLDEHGFGPKRVGVRPVTGAPAQVPLDHNLQAALQQLQGFDPATQVRPAGGGAEAATPMGASADAGLAAQLMSALQAQAQVGQPPSGWVRSVSQRMALAGGLIEDIVVDPRLPADVKQAIQDLRFPVMKVALSDESFFGSQEHPLRVLLNELHTMSMLAPVFGPEAIGQVGQLIRQVRSQLDLPASQVSAGLEATPPVRDADVASFLHWQQDVGEKRRQAIVQKVKSVVNQEITSRLADSDIPESTAPVFLTGFGPIMCLLLARHGRESAEWKAATHRLDTLSDSLRLRPHNPDRLPPREKLMQSIELDLRQAGMTGARVDELMNALREAYETLDRRRQEAETEVARVAEEAQRETERAPAEHHPAAAELKAELEALFTGQSNGAGSSPQRADIDRALETIYREPAGANGNGFAYTESLITLLAPGAWFRVYSPDEQTTHWLRVASYYPRQDVATFATFDGKIVLSLPGARVVEDLAAGRTEPVSPDPSVRRVVAELVQRFRGTTVEVP